MGEDTRISTPGVFLKNIALKNHPLGGFLMLYFKKTLGVETLLYAPIVFLVFWGA